MEQLMVVSQANGVWCVEVRGYLEPVVFQSAGDAERVARRLACCFAEAGYDVGIQVRDDHDAVVGAHRYFATPPAPALEEPSASASASTPWRRRAVDSSPERISAVSCS